MKTMTKTVIMQGFVRMLERMPFDKITVSALTKECGISHNTFYYHYQDIYALLEAFFHQYIMSYTVEDGHMDWAEMARVLLNNCKDNKRLVYHAFNSLSRERLERVVFESSDDFFSAYVRQLAGERPISEGKLRSVSELLRYCFFGYFLKFLWNNMEDDVGEIIESMSLMFEDFARHTLE